MMEDGQFEPRLGRLRALGSRYGRKYLHQVLRARNRAGAGAARGGGFHGNRIGRGCGVGRVLASRNAHAAYRKRRVIIKSRVVKLALSAAASARAHLSYIHRDGVARDGSRSAIYGPSGEGADGRAFIERSSGDRHQFRFIVSPEDGAEYEDLKPLTRRLMARMEEDLGTTLDWVAVDHFNTGHPHTHILLRGKDEHGGDLIIARDYITTGMRERAAELVQLDLGPVTDIDIERRLLREVEQERLTSLDRQLLKGRDEDGFLTPPATGGPVHQTMLQGRLRKLARLGLAEEGPPGRWRLAPDLSATLQRMGERGDIIKTMHRELAVLGHDRPDSNLVIHEPAAHQGPLVGRIVARGLSDELRDRHYLIIDGIDGRTWHVDVGAGRNVEPLPEGAVVRVGTRLAEPREVDRAVASVAAANGGRYSVDLHLAQDPSATQAFAETHVRRLEAMRRARAGPEREPDGSWRIAADHLGQARAFEQRQLRERPVSVECVSYLPLEQQVGSNGATWLDLELVAASPKPMRDSGFGHEVRQAQLERRKWLIAEGLAQDSGGGIRYSRNLIAVLQRRELLGVAGQLSRELGLEFLELEAGEVVEGKLGRVMDLAGGRFAILEKAKEFTLVPWRPALEKRIGQHVSGAVREHGISWSFGRGRGPYVS